MDLGFGLLSLWCVFTIMSLLAGHHALSNETAFAGDLSFLSTFLARVPTIQIVADWNPRYSSPWHRLKNFTLDERFRLVPSSESDEAWRSILPSISNSAHDRRIQADDFLDGLGLVQHPALGPELVSLAFVHQLHCLVNFFHFMLDLR